MRNEIQITRHYFVDEGGDGTLFSSKGRVIIGTEGCSRFFMLGLLDVSDPIGLKQRLDALRLKLISDPYFKNVPSMLPQERKTAVAFHAKDDLPEVRWEVFKLLRETEGLRYFAVVADKYIVLDYVRQRNARDSSYRYHPNELYDYLVTRLFKNLLQKDSTYEIVFAQRGASDRTEALRRAIETVRDRFAQQKGMIFNSPIRIISSTPAVHGGLQAVDYFTWALQRVYEKGEDRYLNYIWHSVRLVHDMDDRRQSPYGAYYSQKKPLNAAALEWRRLLPGI